MKCATYVMMSVLLFSFSTYASEKTNGDLEGEIDRFDSINLDVESGPSAAQNINSTANIPTTNPILVTFGRNSPLSTGSDTAAHSPFFPYLQPCILSHSNKIFIYRIASGAVCLTSAALVWYGQTPSWCTNSCETITAIGAAFGVLSFAVFAATFCLCDEDHYWDDPLYE